MILVRWATNRLSFVFNETNVDDEDVFVKKPSKQKSKDSAKSKTKQEKVSPKKVTPKKELKVASVTDFFGSGPVKQTKVPTPVKKTVSYHVQWYFRS